MKGDVSREGCEAYALRQDVRSWIFKQGGANAVSVADDRVNKGVREPDSRAVYEVADGRMNVNRGQKLLSLSVIADLGKGDAERVGSVACALELLTGLHDDAQDLAHATEGGCQQVVLRCKLFHGTILTLSRGSP
jgi:hypothetical protein